jgi:hypothetical protein
VLDCPPVLSAAGFWVCLFTLGCFDLRAEAAGCFFLGGAFAVFLLLVGDFFAIGVSLPAVLCALSGKLRLTRLNYSTDGLVFCGECTYACCWRRYPDYRFLDSIIVFARWQKAS